MKLVWFAFTLCFCLLSVIGYVAFQASMEARQAKEEVLLFRQRQNEQLAAGATRMPSVLDPVNTTVANAPAIAPPPPPPASATMTISGGAPAATATPTVTATPAPAPVSPMSPNSTLPPPAPVAGTTPALSPVNSADAAAPAPLTAQQRRLITLPAIARVKEAHLDNGFVLIDAGTNKQLSEGMEFDLRRGNAVVGRVTVTASMEAEEAVADIQPGSIPIGIQPRPGDELVQVVTGP
jgi:hypothetical protein